MIDSFNCPQMILCCKLYDEEKQMQSQSGGAFTAIAQSFLNRGAVVYGCSCVGERDVNYHRIDNNSDLSLIKGSKYVQADLRNSYELISKDLRDGKIVLFSGTPCYVMAVKRVFAEAANYCNLYTVDLVCHGVPSPLIYKSYRESLERREKSKITRFVFRDTTKNWRTPKEIIEYANGKVEYRDDYMQLFLTNLTLRESCGRCPFSKIERCGDFSVGDFWGVDKVHPSFEDDRGVSLLFFNTTRAVELFDSISISLNYKSITERDASTQQNLKSHTIIPKQREEFWSDFRAKGIEYCISHYTPNGIPFRIRRKIKHLRDKLFI